jgi:hypothetical protein
MITNPQMAEELRATAMFVQNEGGLVRVDPELRSAAWAADNRITRAQREIEAMGGKVRR